MSNEKIEQLKELQEYLLDVNNCIQNIIDGKLSIRHLSRYLEIPVEDINKYVRKDSPYSLITKMKILMDADVKQLIIDNITPYENLFNAIFCTDKLVVLERIEEIQFEEVMKYELGYKELDVIKYRYGFITGKKESQADTAKANYMSVEVAVHTEETALRKLKNAMLLKHFYPEKFDKEMITANELTDEMVHFNLELYNTPLSELGLSVRVYNTLYRYGVRNIGQLSEYKISDLYRIRNMGVHSLREVVDALKKQYDIDIVIDKNIKF